jgi:hypothetical protein
MIPPHRLFLQRDELEFLAAKRLFGISPKPVKEQGIYYSKPSHESRARKKRRRRMATESRRRNRG